MEFLNNLGISSILGTIGFGLFVLGAFLILAGIGIISIQQITVKKGKATWIVGLIMAVIGGFFIYPDISKPEAITDSVTPTIEIQSTTTLPNQDQPGTISEWRPIKFNYPSNNLWHEKDGAYTAIGETNTVAWSEESFTGDLEISLDVTTTSSGVSAAQIIVYGNGMFLSKGNLIFTVASDLLAISETSIFEGEGGKFLHSRMASLEMKDQVHSVLIRIKDRKASLSLDGEEIGSVFLDDGIKSEGKIGLLKIWEISEITFLNIKVRNTAP